MENAPELLPGLELYYDAFYALDSDRPVGMTEGRIPRRSIRDYALDYGFSDEQREFLYYAIREMDNERLKVRK
jgi:hypothetical protein